MSHQGGISHRLSWPLVKRAPEAVGEADCTLLGVLCDVANEFSYVPFSVTSATGRYYGRRGWLLPSLFQAAVQVPWHGGDPLAIFAKGGGFCAKRGVVT